MDRPWVIIPTIGRDRTLLAAAIASAAAIGETRGVMVIDNGASPPIDRATLPPAPGLEVIRTEGGRGPSAARNAGLERARGGPVVLLDDDDELIPAGVRAGLALLRALDASAVVSARINVTDGLEESKPVPAEWAGRPLPSAGDVFRPIALFGASGAMVSARAIDGGARFDEGLWIGEDRDFLRRCADLGPVGVNPEPALRVRIHRAQSNLSGASHLERRIRDHLVLLGRWTDAASAEHHREATRWLVNHAAKAGAPDDAWRALCAACAARGWRVPMKARLRRALG